MTRKEKKNAYMKAWYKKNPEKRKDHDIKAYVKFKGRYVANAKKWRLANPERYNELQRQNYNPLKQRDYSLKSKYGITLDEYNQMLISQGGVCASCQNNPGYTLVVDHNHKTGKIRGLLCQRCNVVAGFLEQDGIIENVSAYLKRFH